MIPGGGAYTAPPGPFRPDDEVRLLEAERRRPIPADPSTADSPEIQAHRLALLEEAVSDHYRAAREGRVRPWRFTDRERT